MKQLVAYSVPKVPGDPAANEDSYNVSLDGRTAAVSDGASESYDPALWSRTLVDKFIELPRFRCDWVEDTIQRYEHSANTRDLAWYAEAALERGSFATLVGFCHKPRLRYATILAIGDSLAVLADGGEIIRSFPYQNAEQFKSNPRLLATRRERNQWLRAEPQKRQARDVHAIWRFDRLIQPRLLLMTDALGAWLLANPQRLHDLLNISTYEEFSELVQACRERDEMRRDDTTLLVFEEGDA